MLNKHNYNPDVLSCLANLSNDQVFTPPNLANQMLDLLPDEIWRDKNTKFLDPVCKTGVFLREISKRLMDGLKNEITDTQTRIDHILKNQIFGIATIELTELLAKRSVYCSKQADGKYSICNSFTNKQGNILFIRMNHIWINGKCEKCGASQSVEIYNRENDMENFAYPFIHGIGDQEIMNMKFDVIIGNPPYQLNDSGNGVSATPIFQHFVEQAIKLNPKYLSMIIPARWYAGGKGLSEFRETMINDVHISKLVDYETSKDCFDKVNIAGGICYFLRDRNYSGPCEITNVTREKSTKASRPLNEFPILLRSNMAISIVHKILDSGTAVISDYAYPRNPFGFPTNYRGRDKKEENDIEILTSVGFKYVNRSEVTKNSDIIDSYKVLIGRLVPSNGELDVDPKEGYKVITDTRIILPGQINTETYLDIGIFKTEQEAMNFEIFLKSKFPRFLLRQAISSLNVTRECFRFVPVEDFHEEWNDEKLYAKYKLSKDEITYIESIIKPMELKK